jgi:hypothetical protein
VTSSNWVSVKVMVWSYSLTCVLNHVVGQVYFTVPVVGGFSL